MKQVVQNYKTGELKVEEIPLPSLGSKGLLVKTKASLISAGTERTKVETAQMNIIEKAISRLDLVKIVLNNVKQEGILFTLKKAFNKLDMPISLGYSCAGEVIEVGESLSEFKTGDRVACVGEEVAAHSQINCLSPESAVTIPESVDYTEASFVALGAIALNAVELAQIAHAESVTVIGLGLIGQIIVQILKARGARVLGIDIDADKLALADKFRIDAKANPFRDDVETAANNFSYGRGVDAIIIAAASKNNLPIKMAGRISRNKGRIILVGAMPIIIPRKDYYEKELYFMISRGFGSGMYYPAEKDRRYPYNYKSRSAKENMSEFLSMLADKKVQVYPLITHRFSLEQAQAAYNLIREGKAKYLGIVFEYDSLLSREKSISVQKKEAKTALGAGFIGAGSFAQGYLLPILKRMKNIDLVGVSTKRGISAKNIARKFNFQYCTTDYNQILEDKNINCIFIVTRHNLHAKFVVEALEKGKNIFVEKPLCVNETELKDIISAYQKPNAQNKKPILMVGFNRRFSPFVRKVKEFYKYRTSPLVINYRINAGNLPLGHWVHSSEGEGRIIGEVCHFLDLLNYLTNSFPEEITATSFIHPDENVPCDDNVLITLKFTDGSIATINYNSVGDVSLPRERIEIFGENSAAIIDNFKKLSFYRGGSLKAQSTFTRDMGYKNEMASFINSLFNKESPMPFNELVVATLTSFKIKEALLSKAPVKLDLDGSVGNEKRKI